MSDHYIRESASGSNDGSDWVNAWTDLPDTFVRGDTYYVADGAYGTHYFNQAVDGTTYIYLKKATVAAHGTETGWNDDYGNGQAILSGAANGSYIWRFGTSYWDIDGATGGGPGAWESGHGFYLSMIASHYEYGVSITTSGVTHLNFSHVDIGNGSGDPGPGCDRCIYSTLGATDITLSYCYIHHAGDVGITLANPTRWIFEYCRLRNLGDTGDVSEDCGGGTNHGAGIELTGTTTDCTIRYCSLSNMQASGWIGIYDTGTGAVDGLYIHGNLFFNTSDYLGTWGNGIIYNVSGTTEPIKNIKIYNNTFANLNYATILGLTKDTGQSREHEESEGNEFVNNIIYNTVGTPVYVINYKDHNASDDAISGDSNYQELTSSPFVDGANNNFALSGPTIAGASMGSTYITDMLGNTRGDDGTLDRGAYEYDSVTPSKLVMVLK